MELIVRAEPHYARFLCPDGNSTFSVHLVEELPPHDAVIYFECDDLDERVQGLINKGLEFDSSPTDKSWRWREAELRDPDGNRIKLFYGGEDRINPPWRV